MKTNSLRRNRSLQIESLEHREMLSVNPLGIANNAPAVYAGAVPAPIVAAAEVPDAGDTLATAQAIAIGESVDGYIGDGDNGEADVDLYQVTVTAGQKLVFTTTITPDQSTVDTYLRLFKSDGTELASNDDGGPDFDHYLGRDNNAIRYSQLTYAFATAGTYYIGVSAWGNTEYELPNPDTITNTKEPDYSDTTGYYTLAVDVATFSLDSAAATGTQITANFTGKANTLYTLASVVGGDYSELFYATTNAAGKGTFTVPQDGTLYYGIEIYEGRGRILQTISVKGDDWKIVNEYNTSESLPFVGGFDVDIVPEITSVVSGATVVEFKLTDETRDAFGLDDIIITGRLDGAITDSTYTVSGDDLYDEGYAFLYKDGSKTDYRFIYEEGVLTDTFYLTGLAQGTAQTFRCATTPYFPIIVAPSNTVTTTTLSVEVGDTLATAQAIAIGESVTAYIGDGLYEMADVDLYEMTVTAGQKLVFRANSHLDANGEADAYPEMRLFDSTGTELNLDDDYYDPEDGWMLGGIYTFATAGTYYIGVSSENWEYVLPDANTITGTSDGTAGMYTFSVFAQPTGNYTADNVNISFTGKANTKYSLAVDNYSDYSEDLYTTTTDADGVGMFDIPCDGDTGYYYSLYEGELEKIPPVADDYGYYYDEWDYVDKADHSKVAYLNMFALWSSWDSGYSLSPATPTGLTAGTITATTISLSWTAGATSYTLQYKTGDGEWSSANVTITGTSAIVTGLTAETAYQFRVNATDAGGTSGWSDEVGATTTAMPAVPTTPPNFKATTITWDSVTLSWTAVAGAADYVLQYKTGNGDWVDVETEYEVNGTMVTVTVTDLTAGTYYFRLAATNEGGDSSLAATNATTTLTSASKQQPPNNVKVDVTEGKETKSATVTWTAPAGATDKTVYVIQYREANGGKWKSVSVKATNKAGLTKDLTLKAGTEYEFQMYVKGVKNGLGASEVISAGTVRIYAVIPAATLTTLTAAELRKLGDFYSQEEVAVKVKNLIGTNAIGTAKKSVEVDTLTVTYTWGKTKADKIDNLETVTLSYADGVWTSSAVITQADGITWEYVNFGDGIIWIMRLPEPHTAYTVTVRFSNLTKGSEAASAKATSKALSTTKANWTEPPEVDAEATGTSVTVYWSTAEDDDRNEASSYTVKAYIWTGTKYKAVKKVTVKVKSDDDEPSVKLKKLKLGDYFITVTANADKTHVAGIEEAVDDLTEDDATVTVDGEEYE
ncbi:hypothetical protein FACS1894170_01990 [Planctomycetales bacterium]|nr:hypothetical protein FACS1894170_01990 [Planctomycetales bacterium]